MKSFTGYAPSPLELSEIVRRAIPTFDSDASIDPSSDRGTRLRLEYVGRQIPELLTSMASHAPDTETWYELLARLKEATQVRSDQAVVEQPRNLGAIGLVVLPAAQLRWAVDLTLTGCVLAIAVLLGFLLKKIPPSGNLSDPATIQGTTLPSLPRNPIFSQALTDVLDMLRPVLSMEQVTGEVSANDEFETKILTDSVTQSRLTRDQIDFAKQLLTTYSIKLPFLLSFEYLTDDCRPTETMAAYLEASAEIVDKLESRAIAIWLADSRATHRETQNQDTYAWQQYLFSPNPPGANHTVYELSAPEHQPQQSGWYPTTWLHYIYLVN